MFHGYLSLQECNWGGNTVGSFLFAAFQAYFPGANLLLVLGREHPQEKTSLRDADPKTSKYNVDRNLEGNNASCNAARSMDSRVAGRNPRTKDVRSERGEKCQDEFETVWYIYQSINC